MLLMAEMQNLMTDHVGIFRNAESLQAAVAGLRDLYRRACRVRLASSRRGANPELVAAYRLPRMLKLALCVAEGALARTESRGAHYREDYPQRNDRDWLQANTGPLGIRARTAPELDYEPIDVMRMELPPGWRGYGARDYHRAPGQPRGARRRSTPSHAAHHGSRRAVAGDPAAVSRQRCHRGLSRVEPNACRRPAKRSRDQGCPTSHEPRYFSPANATVTAAHQQIALPSRSCAAIPRIHDDQPHWQRFTLWKTGEGMTLFIALSELRETPGSLAAVRLSYAAPGICGSCGMLINGRPGLACRTLTRRRYHRPPASHRLPGFALIGDLSVDTGRWMQGHERTPADLGAGRSHGTRPRRYGGADGAGARRKKSTNSNAVSSAVAVSPPAGRRRCARTLSVPWD
jgi:hypothetical protein